VPESLLSQVEADFGNELDAVRREAQGKVDAAVARAGDLIDQSDFDGARKALASVEEIRYSAGRIAARGTIAALEARIEEAEAAKLSAAERVARARLDATLAAFESHVKAGRYAEARKAAGLAAAKEKAGPVADALKAAARVATVLAGRDEAMRNAARALIGKQTTLLTKTTPRKGKVEAVDERGIVLQSTYRRGGESATMRQTVKWSQLAPKQLEELAAGWKPAGPDGALARAMLALSREDAAGARKELAAAGEHPLAAYYLAKFDAARKQAAYDEAMERARSLIDRKDWKGAAGAVEAALAQRPGDVRATRLMAEISRRAAVAVTIHWSIADVADVYLNGAPLREYRPDFRTRRDEAPRAFSAAATLKNGDVITVGGRRGASYGFLLLAVDEDGRVVWRTDPEHWKVYFPEQDARWRLPQTALDSRTARVSVQPSPWGPQRALQRRFGGGAQSVWHERVRFACLFSVVELDSGAAVPASAAAGAGGGLIGHWKFDDGQGRIARDSSGRGNHGQVRGGARWTAGRLGGALEFDGTDGFVSIPNESDFDITGRITVAAWIKVAAFTKSFQSIVTKGDRAWRLHRAAESNSPGWACSDLSRDQVGDLFGKAAVDDGRWHHVAGVHDGTRMYLFVDGKVDASARTSPTISVNDYSVLIGENAQQTGRHWRGLIDDVRIYDRALTAREIRALCGRTTGAKDVADRLPPLTIDLGEGVTLELVHVPPGRFTMGSEDGQPDERPVHEVEITRGFYIGRYEVTEAQYQRVMRAAPAGSRGPEYPVAQVSWDEAALFCRRLSAQARRRCRLPTEAEWEYACRAGSKTRYCFGGNSGMLGDHAWFKSNSGGETHPVGRKKPNAWGLHDVHGNVWEWCLDWYAPQYIVTGDLTRDPTGPRAGSYRVHRGGSWANADHYCRSSRRPRNKVTDRSAEVGFRVVASVEVR
jgi:formylglycine-generating enzyme required for sulfatase activity/tetratricopeptide (TPR) repeat protein